MLRERMDSANWGVMLARAEALANAAELVTTAHEADIALTAAGLSPAAVDADMPRSTSLAAIDPVLHTWLTTACVAPNAWQQWAEDQFAQIERGEYRRAGETDAELRDRLRPSKIPGRDRSHAP